MKYTVSFILYHNYTVEAEDEDEAIEKAKEELEYEKYCCCPATDYDEIEVWEA